MKLFLTSYRIPAPEELFELVGKRPEDIRMAVIPNAKDYYAERARDVKIEETTAYLANVGLASSIIDLRDHFRSYTLERRLRNFDLLWVMGGNTFCLRDEMRRSGFDRIISGLLADGLVYGGESAGAVAAGTSLRGIEPADEPRFAKNIIGEGLNLIPYFVLPHVDDEGFKDAVNNARGIHPDSGARLELTNAQVAVIQDKQLRILEGARQE